MTEQEAQRLADLEADRAVLVGQLRNIDAHLATRKRGSFKTVEDYGRWKAKAIYAKKKLSDRLDRINLELRPLRAKVSGDTEPHLRQLLYKAMLLLKDLQDDVDFAPHEEYLLREIEEALGVKQCVTRSAG